MKRICEYPLIGEYVAVRGKGQSEWSTMRVLQLWRDYLVVSNTIGVEVLVRISNYNKKSKRSWMRII